MRSHRALLALLLCVLLDAAMPLEPAARGGVQLEIEDRSEEGVCARRRQTDRPEPADARVPRAPAVATASRARVVPIRPARVADATRAAPSRARTYAPDPASPAEDH